MMLYRRLDIFLPCIAMLARMMKWRPCATMLVFGVFLALPFPELCAAEHFVLVDGREFDGSYDAANRTLTVMTPSGAITFALEPDQIRGRKRAEGESGPAQPVKGIGTARAPAAAPVPAPAPAAAGTAARDTRIKATLATVGFAVIRNVPAGASRKKLVEVPEHLRGLWCIGDAVVDGRLTVRKDPSMRLEATKEFSLASVTPDEKGNAIESIMAIDLDSVCLYLVTYEGEDEGWQDVKKQNPKAVPSKVAWQDCKNGWIYLLTYNPETNMGAPAGIGVPMHKVEQGP